eukprot:6996340-Prymnesium_polylepis.1
MQRAYSARPAPRQRAPLPRSLRPAAPLAPLCLAHLLRARPAELRSGTLEQRHALLTHEHPHVLERAEAQARQRRLLGRLRRRLTRLLRLEPAVEERGQHSLADVDARVAVLEPN